MWWDRVKRSISKTPFWNLKFILLVKPQIHEFLYHPSEPNFSVLVLSLGLLFGSRTHMIYILFIKAATEQRWINTNFFSLERTDEPDGASLKSSILSEWNISLWVRMRKINQYYLNRNNYKKKIFFQYDAIILFTLKN